jgi:hypothetical protein
MRFLRVFIALLMLAVIACGVAITLALRNQKEIVAAVLAQINQRTGINIVPAGMQLSLRSHMTVILERPSVFFNGKEVARLSDIRTVINYHALIFQNGLPLHALGLDNPQVRIPAHATAEVSASDLPRLNEAVVKTVATDLDALSGLVRRIEVNRASVVDEDNVHFVDHFDATVYRQRWRPGVHPWLLSFDAGWDSAPLQGLRVAGNAWLTSNPVRGQPISQGRVWFWGLAFEHVAFGGLAPSGELWGSVHATLSANGDLGGATDFEVKQLVLQGARLSKPLTLGDFSLRTAFAISVARAELSQVILKSGSSQLFAASLGVDQPYDPKRSASFHLGGLKVPLADLKRRLVVVRGLPDWLTNLAESIDSGTWELAEAVFEPKDPVSNWTRKTLRDGLHAQATLTGLSFTTPRELKLPPVRDLNVQMSYAAGSLKLTQGSAEIGNSSLRTLRATLDLGAQARRIGYDVNLQGVIDLAELYPAAADILARRQPALAHRIASIDGRAPCSLSATGTIGGTSLPLPNEYAVAIDTSGIDLAIKGAPSKLALKSGQVIVKPGTIELAKVTIAPAVPDGGYAMLNGIIEPAAGLPRFHGFVVDLHQMEAERWIPLVVDPADIAATGPVGGTLTVDSDSQPGDKPQISGMLIMGSGQIQFGFLRSPIDTISATLTTDGKRLKVAIPAGKLEGQPVDLSLLVTDLAHPALEIDGTSYHLDFEVMRFVRLPWSPKTKPHFFAVPVSGHIEAHQANFDKLTMSNVKADFTDDAGRWRVYNFAATSIGGHAELEISGRPQDEWIHMKGRIAAMDADELFLLLGRRPSPLLGKIYATADLWADTDVDFFRTLAGTASLRVEDGTLNRLTLLSRILSLIDLKAWLTAQLPDPRVSGVPFKTLGADFKGRDGDFYTDNLRLGGAVMEIVARGHVRLHDATLNMSVGLVPFSTVNWLVNKIPLIGANLASASSGLLAAYFHVYGPFANPAVVPMPITSLAEFVAKTLSLPINTISPNTIKP